MPPFIIDWAAFLTARIKTHLQCLILDCLRSRFGHLTANGKLRFLVSPYPSSHGIRHSRFASGTARLPSLFSFLWYLPLELGQAAQTWTSNRKPDGKELVTWRLDVRSSWELRKNLDLRVRFFTKIQDQIKKSGSLGFFFEKRNDVSKKGLFFIHFHRNGIPEKEQHGCWQGCKFANL